MPQNMFIPDDLLDPRHAYARKMGSQEHSPDNGTCYITVRSLLERQLHNQRRGRGKSHKRRAKGATQIEEVDKKDASCDRLHSHAPGS